MPVPMENSVQGWCEVMRMNPPGNLRRRPQDLQGAAQCPPQGPVSPVVLTASAQRAHAFPWPSRLVRGARSPSVRAVSRGFWYHVSNHYSQLIPIMKGTPGTTCWITVLPRFKKVHLHHNTMILKHIPEMSTCFCNSTPLLHLHKATG